MKKTITAAWLLLAFPFLVSGRQAGRVDITPAAAGVHAGTGSFMISQETSLIIPGIHAEKDAAMFNYFFKKKYGFALKVRHAGDRDVIRLAVSRDGKLPGEAYRLRVGPRRVDITGGPGGVFYGIQSLIQLIQEHGERLSVPVLELDDAPQFAYRGLMLDVARHFFDMDELKKILDVMASLKLNRFHWHLTDDQGWRLEVKRYPKLTSVGAWRDSTMIGGLGEFNPLRYDGKRTGGYYTQAQAHEIVRYAAERNIVVVPEIEMPGHASAVLAAYPELGNRTGPYLTSGVWGVHTTILNPGEPTFTFLENVLTEVMAIFPGKYIHIGGDEVPKDEWKNSALVQQLIKANHLKDENGLQSWFIGRIDRFLSAHGRNLIGWDEILEGGLSPNATVMSWRGVQGGITAAKQGHQVIMSPTDNMYLDYAQSVGGSSEPLIIGGFLPLQAVYNYNPIPDELTAEQQRLVAGVQGNMWTEYVATPGKLEYMLFPRVAALAEVGWTRPQNKNYESFINRRLPAFLNGLEKNGINYRIPEAALSLGSDGPAGRKILTLTAAQPGSTIYFTLDGYQADNTAERYVRPIVLPDTHGRPLTVNYVVVTQGNRVSRNYSLTFK